LISKTPLKKEDIKLGEPIPWAIYSSTGILRLKAGLSIYSEKNLDILIDSEMLRDDGPGMNDDKLESVKEDVAEVKDDFDDQFDPSEFQPADMAIIEHNSERPFTHIDQFIRSIKPLLEDIVAGVEGTDGRVIILAKNIQVFMESYSDAAIGAIHLYYPHPYSITQPIYAAFLVDLACQAMNYSGEDRLSTVAAGLTANLGMYSIQDDLNNQVAPLTDEQRKQIEHHPLMSVHMLKKIGVSNHLWMDAILGHHERADGSGYPTGVGADMIPEASRLLGIADSYLAMITKRAYNDLLQPRLALQQIYSLATAEDKSTFMSFIKQLGIYPPGTYVRLASDEIAIVISKTKKDSLSCVVACVLSQNGLRLPKVLFRNTHDPSYKIVDFLPADDLPNVDPFELWSSANLNVS